VVIIWEADKIAHYKYCYNFVMKAPKCLRKIAYYVVLAGGFAKEVGDLLRGRDDMLQDFEADKQGAKDALDGKKSRF
jgi:hypothetical protein